MVTLANGPVEQFRIDLDQLTRAWVSGAELGRLFSVHRNVAWNWRNGHGPSRMVAIVLRPKLDELLAEIASFSMSVEDELLAVEQFCIDVKRLREVGVSGIEIGHRLNDAEGAVWVWENHLWRAPTIMTAMMLRPKLDQLLEENGLTSQS